MELKYIILPLAVVSLVCGCSPSGSNGTTTADKTADKTQVPPVAPGTLPPGPTESTPSTNIAEASPSPSSFGSFQGPLLNTAGTEQAVLTLDVWIHDNQTSAQLTVSPNGLSASIPVDAGGKSFQFDLPSQAFGKGTVVSVSGAWNGSAWTGQILTSGRSDGTFTLVAGASTHAAISVGQPSGTFDGILKYNSSGGTRAVSLMIVPMTNLGDALAATIATKVPLTATLKYANALVEPLTNVVWDREASTLSADGTLRTSLGTTSLRCQMSEMNSGAKDVLQCAFTTSKSGSAVATGTLSQTRVVTAPPYPAAQPAPPAPTPSLPVPMPPPPPPVIVRNSKEFVGTAVFTNEQGQKQTRTLTLTLTLASNPTGLPQPAKVKFIVDGSRVGANFIEASYNGATGELHAKELLTLGALAGQLELACTGVPFEAVQYDFNCDYQSSVTNVVGAFHLSGTQK